MLKYINGLEIPLWLVSDGTLRMLALSLLAYLPDLTGIYLVEEPENGIHPQAVETVWQSLQIRLQRAGASGDAFVGHSQPGCAERRSLLRPGRGRSHRHRTRERPSAIGILAA